MNAKKLQEYAAHPAAFRDDLLVDVDGSVRRFGDVMDPWQREDFAALDPALMRCNGRSPDGATMRAYLERGRGHSKTTDLAVMAVWALTFATRPIKGFAIAADKDQAGLLKDATDTIVRLNPWLDVLDVQKGLVVNTGKGKAAGSKLEIMASDVGSSYGILPDLIIADELTHWAGDGSLWHSIISSAAKRSNCFLCVISNAGFADSWQWQVRETARTDDAWYFSRLDGPQASWLTQARLDEQRRMLPAIAYERLWGNRWSSGGGDALTEEDIDRAFIPGLEPMTGQHRDYRFVAGLDLGLTRDCAAVIVLAIPNDGFRIRLAHHRLWRPLAGKKINLLEVERHVVELDCKFRLEYCAFDPWQAEHLAQTIEVITQHARRDAGWRPFGGKPFMREVPPTAANLREQATTVIEAFNDRRLQFFDCEPLRRDLKKLRVEEKSYGVRLTSPRDGEGHGDSFSAFSLALLLAHEIQGEQRMDSTGTSLFFGFDDEDPWKAFEQRQRTYEREQRALLEDDDPTGLKEAIREGRVTICGPENPFQ